MTIVNEQGLTEKEFLEQYDSSKYPKPSLTADVLLFTIDSIKNTNYKKNDKKVLKLLLIKRKNHPFIQHWAIPGGFVDIDEPIDMAALRELKEETNVEDVYLEQLYTFGQVNRDPRMRVVSTAYMALVDREKLNPRAGDDAQEVDWFAIEREVVVPEKMMEYDDFIEKTQTVKLKLLNDAIDYEISCTLFISEKLLGRNIKRTVEIIDQECLAADHGKIIDYAMNRLKNKLEYTQIAFNLVPEYFTLSELQQVYQVISGKEEKPAGFRRKIKDMVIETDHMQNSKGHRPAKLFTYNKYWHLK
ncbi:MAG: NUDIX hydrolase [Clostridia bacterium]|nr:NUDIX hydrolase [Clostridia bacterium]